MIFQSLKTGEAKNQFRFEFFKISDAFYLFTITILQTPNLVYYLCLDLKFDNYDYFKI